MTLCDPAIIPHPLSIERQPGTFELSPATPIIADDASHDAAQWLAGFLRSTTVFHDAIAPAHAQITGSILLRTVSAVGKSEGYTLRVGPDGISIIAATTAGVFYGLQTLRQLLPAAIENGTAPAVWHVPCLVIDDAPRYSWRGFMLDEARHFQGKQSVLRLLDLMALIKLNRFHWHLTDDQGWRIEVKRSPRLTEIGGGRRASPFGQRFALGEGHEGFYTQEDIREIVAYATALHISIVPEIEMPGHAQAAIAGYPRLGCTGQELDVCTRAGITKEVFCAGRESTYTFLQDVLEEVLDLFPGTWVHIGGDEVPKARWHDCPHCQQRIHSLGLKNEDGLQEYFTDRIADWLEQRGRRSVAWAGGWHSVLPKRGIAQFWLAAPVVLAQHLAAGRHALGSGYPAAYLDMKYVISPLELSYMYDPFPSGAAPAVASRLVGVEAPLWTEWVKTRDRLDYQTFPRLLAFAEKGWTNRPRDYASFRERVFCTLPRLDALGVQYAPEKDWDPPMSAQWIARVAMKVFWARLEREEPQQRMAAEDGPPAA
jgi:hexosaminidase